MFVWCFLAVTVEGMSHTIDRSFKLIFWGTELGEFQVKGETGLNKYSVSTQASGKSFIRLFSRYEISSGAVGIFTEDGELIPSQSVTRWNTRGKFKQTELTYRDGTLKKFQASPDLTKGYHIDNPIGIGNTIDPVSLVLWLLLERSEEQLCRQRVRILDGFRMSELSFENKNKVQDMIVCFGKIKRISGFKKLDLNKKPLKFKITYVSVNKKNFELSRVEIETIFGKVILQ